MNALKALVVVMGVLIVVGLGAVVWKIAEIGTRPAGPPPALSLELPGGCTIAGVAFDEGRLAVRTASAAPLAGCGTVYLIDAGRGAIVGTVTP